MIVKSGNKILCDECRLELGTDGAKKINFCPRCGVPFSMDAAVKREQEDLKSKLMLLCELQDEIENGKDPEKAIEQFIREIEESLD